MDEVLKGVTSDMFSSDLKSLALGSYVTDHAIIKLTRDVSFWLQDNEPTLARLVVFIHEYMHYLHNFSTVAGIYGFVAQLRLTKLFMGTVGVAGQSYGDSVLDQEALAELRGVAAWLAHLRGGQSPNLQQSSATTSAELTFLNVEFGQGSIHLSAQDIDTFFAEAKFDVKGRHGMERPISIRFGSHVLMEGLAWEVERLLYSTQGGDASFVEQAPPFPYKVARIAFEGTSGLQPSCKMMAKILVLALQTSDPGHSFFMIAQALKTETADKSIEESVADITKATAETIGNVIEALCNRTLQMEVQAFENKGSVGRGLSLMKDWCTTYLRLRQSKPFFELDIIAAGLDREALIDLLKKYPPCPIFQEIGPDDADVEMLLLSPAEPDPEQIKDIGATQGLLQFSACHLRGDRILATSSARQGPCRFYGACKAPLTTRSPDICTKRPWESFSPSDTQGCWYGQGVNLARSRPDL